jgi:hypothetical protein
MRVTHQEEILQAGRKLPPIQSKAAGEDADSEEADSPLNGMRGIPNLDYAAQDLTQEAALPSGAIQPLSVPSVDSVLANDGELDDLDPPEMQYAIRSNPGLDPDYVRYLCTLARHRFATQERDILLAELKLLNEKRKSLFEDKEAILNDIYRDELGEEASVANEPFNEADVPKLRWIFTNRSSLPNYVNTNVADTESREEHAGEEDEED